MHLKAILQCIRNSIQVRYCSKATLQRSLHVTGIKSYSHSARVLNALGSSFKSHSYVCMRKSMLGLRQNSIFG